MSGRASRRYFDVSICPIAMFLYFYALRLEVLPTKKKKRSISEFFSGLTFRFGWLLLIVYSRGLLILQSNCSKLDRNPCWACAFHLFCLQFFQKPQRIILTTTIMSALVVLSERKLLSGVMKFLGCFLPIKFPKNVSHSWFFPPKRCENLKTYSYAGNFVTQLPLNAVNCINEFWLFPTFFHSSSKTANFFGQRRNFI